jgi:hypothetical protein
MLIKGPNEASEVDCRVTVVTQSLSLVPAVREVPEVLELDIVSQVLSVFNSTKLQIVALILLQTFRLHFFSVYPSYPSEQ